MRLIKELLFVGQIIGLLQLTIAKRLCLRKRR